MFAHDCAGGYVGAAGFNTLEPLTKIPTTVYSLADAQLTGILDRPENAAELPRFFAYALLWLLRRRDATEDRAPPAWFDFAVLEVGVDVRVGGSGGVLLRKLGRWDCIKSAVSSSGAIFVSD